jgi:sugar phosphate isomerase/epimerase
MLKLKKSIHLDTLRQPFKTAIVTAAKLGATAVEINGRTDVVAGQLSQTGVRHIRKMLSDLNLSVSAVHFQTNYGYGDLKMLDQRVDGTKATLKLAYELGSHVVVNRVGKIPDEPTDEGWTTMVQALADIGNYSQKAGAWLAARTGADDGETLKGLIDSLPIQSLMVDFDPAELVINRHSPTDAMKQLAKYVVSCRARDAVTDFSLGRGVEVTLGQGSVDWPALLGQLEEKAYAGYLTIDREQSQNPVVDCEDAFKYLTSLFG